MSFVWKKHFRVPKICLCCVGVWPEQPRIRQICIRIIAGFLLTGIVFIQIKGLYEEMDLSKKLLQLTHVIFISLCSMKFYSFVLTITMAKNILNAIEENWNYLTDEHEIKTLNAFEEFGSKMSRLAMFFVFFSNVFVMFWPIRGTLVNIILSLNNSEAILLPFPMEQYVPSKGSTAEAFVVKYYFLIVICLWFYMSLMAFALIGADSFYFCCVQHVCGIFTITGCRLKEATNQFQRDFNTLDIMKWKVNKQLCDFVKMHTASIELADMVQEMNAIPLMITITMGTILIAAIGVQIITDKGSNGWQQFLVGLCNCIIHFYFYCWTGQNVLEHSTQIFHIICKSYWYEIPPSCQKTLMLIMKRSLLRPSTIVAGPFCALNLQNFTVVLKSAVSYFTVLLSFF